MKIIHREANDNPPSLPKELSGDFPQPVHATAAREHELQQQLDAARRAMAESDEYYMRVLGAFPDDKHSGGPVRNPFHDVDPSAGEFVLPKHVMDRRNVRMPRIGIDYARDANSTQRRYGEYLDRMGLRPPPLVAHVPADSITCHPPGSQFPTVVETDCPCGRHLHVGLPKVLLGPA